MTSGGQRREGHRPHDGARPNRPRRFGVGRFHAVRGGVQQSESGMRHQSGVGFGQIGVESAQHADPDFHVLTLRFTHLPFGGRGQVREVTVLNPDEVRFSEREIEVEIDQAVQGRSGAGAAVLHGARTGEQPGADLTSNSTSSDSLLGKCR